LLFPICRPTASGHSRVIPTDAVIGEDVDVVAVLRVVLRILGVTALASRGLIRGGVRTGRFVGRNVNGARRRGGGGEAGMIRLFDLHAASCAGDTLIAIGL